MGKRQTDKTLLSHQDQKKKEDQRIPRKTCKKGRDGTGRKKREELN